MTPSLKRMSNRRKVANLGAVTLPPLAFVVAVVLLWHRAVDGRDLAILAVLYVTTAFGITLGFHRLLTHRSFATHRAVEYALAVIGTMAVQGPVITWVADHRKHHAHTDREGDPHSPHVGRGAGVRGALGGLFFAHVGWLFTQEGKADASRYAPDLSEDRGMRLISRYFAAIIALGLVIPAAAGYALHGFTLAGAATGLLWGGLVRVFLLHHVTWSINSVCHFIGRRRFAVDDESRNVFWLALPSLGEAWHHNHHAFPRSAVHGLRRFELDPTGWLVRALRAMRLAWDVVEISPERQAQKLVA